MTKSVTQFKLSDPVQFLALGFGSGLAPKAPGTFGTLAAIPLYLVMALTLSIPSYLVLTLFISVVGIAICGSTAKKVGVHDHPAIVWDEIAGFLITMAFVPLTLVNIVLGFALFRLFDIAKPWPISIADKRVHGGLGIMLDDVLAGILACVCLHLLLAFIPF
ncbi:phosphatidylglycerophosphatase A family protein [Thalassotalea euphylliae]|uniref:Phosphatidylglycerophosphatase A n=1 Tax=Thalassotalea euphylliae TaxID=1655234 RepID=A0A3E0UFJ5_9GAMM|nr:phosphatidylglycerophosphatase A [Thalassotalea euphylliae]REL34915.1 phosphatidylglycerophosphatase A [Thalassotalea euphylliae]